MVNVGDAKITITADDKASAAMTKVGKSSGNLGKQFKLLGAAIIGAAGAMGVFIIKASKDWAAAGDQLDKMADRTGIAVEKLGELDYVLNLSGSSIEDFEKANKKLSKTILDAGYGLETYVRAFEQLGLDIVELKKLSPEDQFWAVANALAEIEDKSKQIALAQEVFGRAGTSLLPMLAEGSVGILAMQKEFSDFGYQWTTEAAAAAAGLNDATQKLTAAWDRVKFTLIEDLDLASRLDVLSEYLKKTAEWIKLNKDTIDTWVDMVEAIGKVLFALYKVLEFVGKAIAWISILQLKIAEALTPWDIFPKAGDFPIAMPAPGALDIFNREGLPSFEGASGSNINIYLDTFVGNESALQEFARVIGDELGQNSRRTMFSAVNEGYGVGNSAP